MKAFILAVAGLVLASLTEHANAGGCTCNCPVSAGCKTGCKVCESDYRYCDCVGSCNIGSCKSGYSEISQWHKGCFLGFAKEHCRRNCGKYPVGVCTECKSGYYGSTCQNTCRCYGTSMGHSTCNDGLKGNGFCYCASDRYGQYCQYERLECYRGSLQLYSNPARCNCYPGWTGTLCDEQEVTPTYAPTREPTDAAVSSQIGVIVKTLTGKSIPIDTDQSDTVAELKAAIEAAEGIDADQQRLIFSGAEMANGNTLQSYNVQDGSTIHLVLGLRG